MDVTILLFDGFEPLDAFGPVEVLGHVEECRLSLCSAAGGLVTSFPGTQVATVPIAQANPEAVLLVPGGIGTRRLVDNASFLQTLRAAAEKSSFCLTVCTGSALLARTGLLDGRHATSNKRAFRWVTQNGPRVKWQQCARWTVDGKYYTASGVSAGIDMCLAFVANQFGASHSVRIAKNMEYLWNTDSSNDPFAPQVPNAE